MTYCYVEVQTPWDRRSTEEMFEGNDDWYDWSWDSVSHDKYFTHCRRTGINGTLSPGKVQKWISPMRNPWKSPRVCLGSRACVINQEIILCEEEGTLPIAGLYPEILISIKGVMFQKKETLLSRCRIYTNQASLLTTFI